MSTSADQHVDPEVAGDLASASKLAQIIQRPTAKAPLDDVDVALLKALNDDSRLSQRALSREVGLSAPAIGERLVRLERLGVIRGYTLDLDWAALGYSMSVHIPMTAAAGADLGVIIEHLVEMPELEDLDIVTGQWDLIAKFRLRDHAHLQEVLLVRIWQIPGVQRVETFLGLGNYRGAGVLRDV
ncbi:Lrp/AsnC family transcriptional regulator [Leifsonia sp. NPDC058230]|uniref:Lrp/AsnC family transcriptional regulator n=1 Tax=Leifsonia sp. NPDC058230 TaxID=3346391 RepID=UPI0036D90B2A